MPRYRHATTGLIVRRDDDALDRFARWVRLDEPEPTPAEPSPPEPVVPLAADDVFTPEAAAGQPVPQKWTADINDAPTGRVARETARGWYQIDGAGRKYRRRDLPADVEIVEG